MGRKRGLDFLHPAIYLTDFEMAQARANFESAKKDAEDVDPEDTMPERFCESVTLIKSSRELEAKYIDYLSDLFRGKTVPVCLLLKDPVDREDDYELIQWLRKKSQHSSLFVSFGREYFLTKEEVEEISPGLELSNANFTWVLQFPKGEITRIEDALPECFLERIQERGRIVEGWGATSKDSAPFKHRRICASLRLELIV